jgi:hypothetical protein
LQQPLGLVEVTATALDQAEDVGGGGVCRAAGQYGAAGRLGLDESPGLQMAGGGLDQRVHRSVSLPEPGLLASQKKRRPVLGTGRRP